VLADPRDLAEGCAVPLQVDVPRATDVEQWDGAAYHAVAAWQATGGPLLRHVPYEPLWPYVYWDEGVLFQFADTFVEGAAIQVQESTGFELPQITSTPPATGQAGQPLGYTASGAGDEPLWWSLRRFPLSARIDPGSGAIDWTPAAPGIYTFEVLLTSDRGVDSQAFQIEVP